MFTNAQKHVVWDAEVGSSEDCSKRVEHCYCCNNEVINLEELDQGIPS